jgi:hypothetical protein
MYGIDGGHFNPPAFVAIERLMQYFAEMQASGCRSCVLLFV